MGDRPVVLIVEDDEDCRMVLADLLEFSGYEVVCSSGAHSAVEMAQRAAPSLVLLDYTMPDGDGGWVVRSLRACGGGLERIPVVLTTGSIAGRQIAHDLGVLSLEKPFDVDRLLDLVRALAPASPP
jgi:CheY-like chemotaxis protein